LRTKTMGGGHQKHKREKNFTTKLPRTTLGTGLARTGTNTGTPKIQGRKLGIALGMGVTTTKQDSGTGTKATTENHPTDSQSGKSGTPYAVTTTLHLPIHLSLPSPHQAAASVALGISVQRTPISVCCSAAAPRSENLQKNILNRDEDFKNLKRAEDFKRFLFGNKILGQCHSRCGDQRSNTHNRDVYVTFLTLPPAWL